MPIKYGKSKAPRRQAISFSLKPQHKATGKTKRLAAFQKANKEALKQLHTEE